MEEASVIGPNGQCGATDTSYASTTAAIGILKYFPLIFHSACSIPDIALINIGPAIKSASIQRLPYIFNVIRVTANYVTLKFGDSRFHCLCTSFYNRFSPAENVLTCFYKKNIQRGGTLYNKTLAILVQHPVTFIYRGDLFYESLLYIIK
jgi:hypothetical protein